MKGFIHKIIIYSLSIVVLVSCVEEDESSNPSPSTTTTDTTLYNVETIAGRTDGKGLDLVITGDGFTAGDMSTFKSAVKGLVDYIIQYDPVLLKQSRAWNFHRVDVISATSDLESATDTAFESSFNCEGGSDRSICLDDSKVQVEIAKAVPQFDYIIVIVNSTKYGGTGGIVGKITMNSYSRDIAVHELGHLIANLADEYSSGGLTAPAYEPDEPNVTINNNPATVKWKHWMSDPNVDLFEGGYYTPTGVWRPTYNSIMNNLGEPLYPVNLEAWSLGLYSEVGTHYSQTPQSNSPSHTSGSELEFSVELSIGSDLQKVDWYVDGVLALSNSTTFSCCSLKTNSYVVRAEITDSSGAIAYDPNRYSSSTITWNVSVN